MYKHSPYLLQKQTMLIEELLCIWRPRLFLDQKISRATITDLFLVDVWALGMIFFSMINPSLKHPFILEMRSAQQKITSQEELKVFVRSLLSQGKHPLPDKKYEVERATVWRGLEGVYKACTNFDRKSRLSLKEVATIMRQENKRFLRDVDVVHLGISQGTAVQCFDEQHAMQLQVRETVKDHGNLESTLVNDGTNACAFLSVKIAERILSGLTEEDSFAPGLAKAVEHTILDLTRRNKCAPGHQQILRHHGGIPNPQRTEDNRTHLRLFRRTTIRSHGFLLGRETKTARKALPFGE